MTAGRYARSDEHILAAREERIRRLHADVELQKGRYGQFKVLVDGETVIDGGRAALPSGRKVLDAVRTKLFG